MMPDAGACIIGPEPEKSPLDSREYRSLTLCNGLKVLLISDADHDKAAAAMDVSVGCFNDPDDLPGLAHFLEHMLFLGTEKYPDEASYAQFLAEKGGYSNAYTYLENTNYQFQLVIPKAGRTSDGCVDSNPSESVFYEALDRFSQFFIAPLFTEAATARELNAVDSEHEKNLQDDSRRIMQLMQSCANKAHPYSKFGTGSKATLWDDPKEKDLDTRAELLAFHKKYYSASIMHLCISSPHSLDTMQEWAVELFSGIANSGAPLPATEYSHVAPLTENEMGRIVHVLPIKDMRMLGLSWLIPATKHAYRSKPAEYVSHLLGHEGKGSLLSLLKAQGWVDALRAGVILSLEHFAVFDVSIDLTKDGVEHIDEIIEMVFGYIRLIKERGVEPWIHQESADLAQMSFRFSERGEPFEVVQSLSAHMGALEEKDYITGMYLVPEYDPQRIGSVLACLTPERVNVAVVGHFVEGSTDRIEKWYGTPYRAEALPQEKIAQWRDVIPSPQLSIPGPNPFIPKDFSLVEEEAMEDDENEQLSGPTRVLDNDKFELHYKLDRTFLRPKVGVRMVLLTPLSYASPKNHVMCNIFLSMLEDELNEYSYNAELAGLSYSVIAQHQGIQFVISGYNDRLDVLMDAILQKMASFEVNQERFSMIYDQLERQWANFDKDQPYQHAMYGMSHLLEIPRWHVEDYLASLRRPGEITAEAVNQFVPELLGRMRAVVLVHGNVTQEWAVKLCERVEQYLKFEGLPRIEQPSRRIVQLPTEVEVVRRKLGPNQDDRNCAVHVSFQVGMCGVDFERDVLLELLSDVMSKPAFHELRTKQQLGYMIFAGNDWMENVGGLYLIVQSTVVGPEELCRRIDGFLDQFKKEILNEMTDAEFEVFVESRVAIKMEKDKRLSARSWRYFGEIAGRTFVYDRSAREVAALRQLKKKHLVMFFDNYVGPMGPSRRKVASLVYGSEHAMPDTAATMQQLGPRTRVVDDVVAFRSSRALYPSPGVHIAFAPVADGLIEGAWQSEHVEHVMS